MSSDVDFLAEELGLLAGEQVEVELDAGQALAALHFEPRIAQDDVVSVVGDGVDAIVASLYQGALVVKLLRDDGERALSEHLLGADHRVKGAESGIVEHDAVGRHSVQQQRVAHHGGFVVVLRRVVAADEQIVDLAGMEQLGRGVDAVGVIVVVCAARGGGASTQQQPHAVVRDVADVVVCPAVCRCSDGDVARRNQCQAGYGHPCRSLDHLCSHRCVGWGVCVSIDNLCKGNFSSAIGQSGAVLMSISAPVLTHY